MRYAAAASAVLVAMAMWLASVAESEGGLAELPTALLQATIARPANILETGVRMSGTSAAFRGKFMPEKALAQSLAGSECVLEDGKRMTGLQAFGARMGLGFAWSSSSLALLEQIADAFAPYHHVNLLVQVSPYGFVIFGDRNACICEAASDRGLFDVHAASISRAIGLRRVHISSSNRTSAPLLGLYGAVANSDLLAIMERIVASPLLDILHLTWDASHPAEEQKMLGAMLRKALYRGKLRQLTLERNFGRQVTNDPLLSLLEGPKSKIGALQKLHLLLPSYDNADVYRLISQIGLQPRSSVQVYLYSNHCAPPAGLDLAEALPSNITFRCLDHQANIAVKKDLGAANRDTLQISVEVLPPLVKSLALGGAAFEGWLRSYGSLWESATSLALYVPPDRNAIGASGDRGRRRGLAKPIGWAVDKLFSACLRLKRVELIGAPGNHQLTTFDHVEWLGPPVKHLSLVDFDPTPSRCTHLANVIKTHYLASVKVSLQLDQVISFPQAFRPVLDALQKVGAAVALEVDVQSWEPRSPADRHTSRLVWKAFQASVRRTCPSARISDLVESSHGAFDEA